MSQRSEDRELPDELRRIFRAIEIDSAEAFAFGDRVVHSRDPLTGKFPGGKVPAVRLVGHLQNLLYAFAYCRRLREPAVPLLRTDTSELAPGFLAGLAAANTSRDRWDEGWTIETLLPQGRILARKGHLEELMWPGTFLSGDGPGHPPRPGASIRIFRPRESRERLDGYYFAFGETPDVAAGVGYVRFYFNIRAAGAPKLLADLTARCNSFQLPFSCKLPDHPALYDRRDTAVLYVRCRFRTLAEALVHRIQAENIDHLDDDVPLFTRRIASGLAYADDPGSGESFGAHRCRLLAEGIWKAFLEGSQDEEARLAAVREVFHDQGLELEHPHLNAGSEDPGSPQCRPAAGSRSTLVPVPSERSVTPGPITRDSEAVCLDAAFHIGVRLCRDAYWAGERCNWIGPAMIRSRRAVIQGQEALKTDVYRGTSGVALFLVRLFRLTGEELFAATARAALAQTISRRQKVLASARASFYTGWMGLACALFEAGEAFGQPELVAQAQSLLTDVAQVPVAKTALDLIHGSASAIPALLIHAWRSPAVLDLAIAHGEHLLDGADRGDIGWSWMTADGRNLYGLSHGAAGIGAALLELYRVTSDDRFRQGAEGAFRYESHWYNHQYENWPKFSVFESEGYVERTYPITWCNGAPGIGLTRLRAFEILGDETYREEAEAALRTTVRSTEELLQIDRHDFSLCHGLSGNAAVLLYGHQILGDDAHRALAEKVGRRGIELYLDRREPWPCGIANAGESPSLMLGLAGIGHFYLRLHDPTGVPPITLLVPPADN